MEGFSLGSIVAHVKADISNFQKGIHDAQASANGFKNKFGDFMDSSTAASQKFARGLTIVGTALSVAGGFAVKSASDFEQNRIAFETMLGSAEKARKLLREVSDFAAKTPFELPEVVRGAKQLLAYNIEAEKIIPTFKALGNIAAGVGKDKLPQLILAFGQVKAATRLTGMELRQFSEAGVPLLVTLAKQMGTTEAEMVDMISAGKVGFPEVEKALFGMSAEGGKFFNLMDRQSKTFSGTMSNLRDTVGRFARDLVGINDQGDIREGSFFAKLSNAAAALLTWLEANKERIKTAVADAFSWAKDNLPIIAGIILGALVPAFVALAVSIGSTLGLLLPFMAAGAALGLLLNTLAEKVGGWSNLWRVLTDVIRNIWSFIESMFKPSLLALWNTFTEKLLPALKRLWDALDPALLGALRVVAAILAGALYAAWWLTINTMNVVIGIVSNLINWFSNLAKWVGQAISAIGGWFGRLPGYVADAVNSVIAWFRGLPGNILGALGNLDNLLLDIGKRIMQGFLNGLKEGFEKVKGFVGGVGTWIKDHKGPIEYDRKLLINSGKAIMTGFNQGIMAGWMDTQKLISGVTMGMASPVAGASSNSVSTNITGPINIGSQQDAEYFFKRLTRNQELANQGMTSIIGSLG